MEDRWRPIKAIRGSKIKTTHTLANIFFLLLNPILGLTVESEEVGKPMWTESESRESGADPVSVARKSQNPVPVSRAQSQSGRDAVMWRDM